MEGHPNAELDNTKILKWYLISHLLARSILGTGSLVDSILNQITQTISGLLSGVLIPMFLELTMTELVWNLAMFFIGLLLFGIGTYVSAAEALLFDLLMFVFIDVWILITGYYIGQTSVIDVVWALVPVAIAFLQQMAIMFPEVILFYYFDLIIASTGFTYVLLLANIGIFLANMYWDWLD